MICLLIWKNTNLVHCSSLGLFHRLAKPGSGIPRPKTTTWASRPRQGPSGMFVKTSCRVRANVPRVSSVDIHIIELVKAFESIQVLYDPFREKIILVHHIVGEELWWQSYVLEVKNAYISLHCRECFSSIWD